VTTKTPWIVIGVIVCGLIAASPSLHAQAPSAPSAPSASSADDEPWSRGVPTAVQEAARAVFLEGNRLFKIPLFAQAVEKYTEALGTWEHPAFYFNLALAQLNLGQDVEAHDNLERAMKYGAAPLGDAEFGEARKQLEELERRLGRLRVSCPTPGAEVTLNGVTLFTGPGSREVWVKAQAHELTAKRRDYVTRVKRVTVAPGAMQELDLPLRKLIEDRPWAVWKPWAVVGTGAAIVAAGGVLHTLSARDFRAYDAGFRMLSCAAMGCTDAAIDAENPGLRAELRRARREQTLAVGGYIAGGAAIAAGAVLVYLNRHRLAEQEEESPRGPGIVIAPVVSGDSLGMLVTVSH
jgi:tetratricopeptide (TPR) repeat protein